jgi:hypothetical protein
VFATKVQLENLTHMFCSLISSCKVYKKGAFSYVFTLKKVPLGMNSKKINLKTKT